MKPSTIQTIVVHVTADNVLEFEIDTDIFDDPFLEAATRAVEKSRKSRGAIIRPTVECWYKKRPNKPISYNSYWILVNAACYYKAEQLREKFKMQSKCDLATQPIHANVRTK